MAAVYAESAWDNAKASGKTTVAVIDGGVDYTHEDLKANLVDETYAKSTYTGKYGSSAVDDTYGHGTFVAGVISAVADNNVGVAGVSFNANVLPVSATNSEGSMDQSDVIEAIEYVTNLKKTSSDEQLKNLRVINSSLGAYSPYVDELQQAIKNAHDAGIIVVAAVGNDASVDSQYTDSDGSVYTDWKSYPASYDDVVSVSALKYNADFDATSGTLTITGFEFDSSYSNYGSSVDLSAPGTDIYSTLSSSVISEGHGSGDGTSFAAPLVSGVAALLYSQNMTASANEIEKALETTADDLGDTGRDNYYGYGMVDAANATKTYANCAKGEHTGTWEAALTAFINLMYLQARDEYEVLQELHGGIGYADIAFIPINHENPSLTPFVVELKMANKNESVQDVLTNAMQQIKSRNYTAMFNDALTGNQKFANPPLAVAIAWDAENKQHECAIEGL